MHVTIVTAHSKLLKSSEHCMYRHGVDRGKHIRVSLSSNTSFNQGINTDQYEHGNRKKQNYYAAETVWIKQEK